MVKLVILHLINLAISQERILKNFIIQRPLPPPTPRIDAEKLPLSLNVEKETTIIFLLELCVAYGDR